LALRLLHGSRGSIATAPRLGDTIRGHELAVYQALETVQVVLCVLSLRLQLGDHCFCGRPLLTTADSSSCRCRQACLAASNFGIAGGDHLSLSVDFFHCER